MSRYVVFAILAAFAIRAAAQQPPAQPRLADRADSAPIVKYDSAYSGYRAFREEPLAPWRETNDEVASAGGHIGIVGGAGHGAAKPELKPQAPNATPSPKTLPQPKQRGTGNR